MDKMIYKTDLRIAPFEWKYMRDIVDLMNYTTQADQLSGLVSYDEVEHSWHSENYDPPKECRLVFDRNERLVAYGLTENPLRPQRAYGNLCIHPDVRHTDIGRDLIRLTDQRFLNDVKDIVPADQPIWVQRWTDDSLTYFTDLYRSEGYTPVRHFFTMYIDLNTPLGPVQLPDGFELRPFDPERDGYAVYEAVDSAFRDHWGYVEQTFEQWRHSRIGTPIFNREMWSVAWDDNRVAGAALCRQRGADEPNTAWVVNLAVPRPYRRRGLGEALLKHSFHRFQQLGFTQAGLGVDSSNTTGAVGLYERAGMYVKRTGTVYRKMYRGKLEDIVE